MPVATIIAIIEAIMQFAPEIPELIATIETAKRLITENRAPTAEEQAAIDAGLAAAHAALQAAAAPAPEPPTSQPA